MKIIDGHVHVASERFISKRFIEGAMENLRVGLAASGAKIKRERLMTMSLARLQDHQADGLVKSMDEAGIDQAVLLLPDFTHTLADSQLTIEEMIAEHHAILKRHPNRFHLFVGIDPRWGRDGLELLKKSVVQYQCSGFKIYPPCGYSPSDAELYPYYEICREYGLPVVLHTGPTSPVLSFGHSQPIMVDKAAMDFPELSFILAHGGVSNVEESLAMASYRPNVYLDIGGYPAILDPNGPRAALKRLFSLGVNHKIIFGTDFPVFNLRAGYTDLLADILDPDGAVSVVSEIDKAQILGLNMERLLPAVNLKASPT